MADRKFRAIINEYNQVAKNFTSIKTEPYIILEGTAYQLKIPADVNFSTQRFYFKNPKEVKDLSKMNGIVVGDELFNFLKRNKTTNLTETHPGHFVLTGDNEFETFRSNNLDLSVDYEGLFFEEDVEDIEEFPIYEHELSEEKIQELCSNKLFIEVSVTKKCSIRLTKRLVQGVKPKGCTVKMYAKEIKLKRNPYFIGRIDADTSTYRVENYLRFLLI